MITQAVRDLKYITSRTACVIIEPVQGEGGIVLSEKGYLEALRRRCDETGALVVFDEIHVSYTHLRSPRLR